MEAVWVERGLPVAQAESFRERVLKILFPIPDERNSPQNLRANWDRKFLADGWAKNPHLPNSNLSISYMMDDVGVCVQLGNICRLYADLLKLETLYKLDRIKLGILVVPSDGYAESLGSNYTALSRSLRDVKTLESAISVPLLFISVDANRGQD